MSDFADLDQEQPREKLTRKQRAERLTSGPRGVDLLTDGERRLLNTLREQGYDIRLNFLMNTRSGERWSHRRVIEKGARSWSHSQA